MLGGRWLVDGSVASAKGGGTVSLGLSPADTNEDWLAVEWSVKHGIDFRSVYAAILEDWLKADSRKVLERMYKPVRVIKA